MARIVLFKPKKEKIAFLLDFYPEKGYPSGVSPKPS